MDIAFAPGSGFDSSVTSLALGLDGSDDVIVGGHYMMYQTATPVALTRLNADASLD